MNAFKESNIYSKDLDPANFIILIIDLADLIGMIYIVVQLMKNLQAHGMLRVCYVFFCGLISGGESVNLRLLFINGKNMPMNSSQHHADESWKQH